jgi:glutathione peroxidase
LTSFYEFTAPLLDGTPKAMADYQGKVVLVVNVASKCGYTPQYEGLEALWRKYQDKGLVILGFPCNQFGEQEPGSASDIAQFCSTTYDVSFPIFGKIDVNGDHAHPLYEYLKHAAKGVLGTESVKWNFTKFLVDRQGKVVHRFAPETTPEALEGDVAKLLA